MAYSALNQLKGTNIPDTWNGIQEFTDWYMLAGMPMLVPWESKVYCSDDATSVCLFRKNNFQVELYLMHPGEQVVSHSHPNIDVILMSLGGGSIGSKLSWNVSTLWGTFTELSEGQEHGGGISPVEDGHVLLAFQKWPTNIKVSSASVYWKGYTAGPKQRSIIKKEYPNAISIDGYADSTNAPPVDIL